MDKLPPLQTLRYVFRLRGAVDCLKVRRATMSAGIVSLALAAALSAGDSAYAAPENAAKLGGAGKLTLDGVTCFKSGSTKVPMVCGEPVVHYRVTTLMGDPLGNYGVSWKVFSFHIADADGKRSENYLAGTVPAPIWEARQSVELSLYGFAKVRNNIAAASTALQFDTGAGVKATGEVSLNVPSGYNWDRFLVVASSGAGPDWACSDKSRPAEPQDAKKLMRSGFELYGLHICPRTSVSVEGLERAISAWCESRPDYRAKYCPQKDKEDQAQQKKPTTDPFAALDKPATKAAAATASTDPFAILDGDKSQGRPAAPWNMDAALDMAEAVRVANAERKRRHDATRADCELALARQERCSKDSCGREPDAQVCVRNVRESGSCTPRFKGESCITIPTYTCVEHGPNPAHTKWKVCLSDKAEQCAVAGKKITSISTCVAERMADQK